MALKEDPAYRAIALRFKNDPKEFELAFAKAWFKLNHRDLGPRARYLGDEVPDEILKWQDPIPEIDYTLINDKQIAQLKKQILDTGLTVPELVRTAWASAASYRDTDMRGGANGARVRLAPQNSWQVNNPHELSKVLAELEKAAAAEPVLLETRKPGADAPAESPAAQPEKSRQAGRRRKTSSRSGEGPTAASAKPAGAA